MLLLRTLVTLLLLVAVGMATVWLQQHPGELRLDWSGWRLEMPVGLAAAAFAVLLIISFLLIYGLVRLGRAPLGYKLARQRHQQQRVLDSVTLALTSLAVGDQGGALTHARQAEHLLGDHPLIELVRAHVARQQGNRIQTRHQLEKMLGHDSTRMLAASALSGMARAEGRIDEAARHAETAYRLLPKHLPGFLRYFDLMLMRREWDKAEEILTRARKAGHLQKPAARHGEALLHLLIGEEQWSEGALREAQLHAQKAQKAEPGFIPANLLLIRSLIEQDRLRAALSTLKRAWKAAPHPGLGELFLRLVRGRKERSQAKLLQGLTASWPAHFESHLLHARFALQHGHPNLARQEALQAAEQTGEARAYQLLIEAEQMAGDASAVTRWQERLAAARMDAVWCCEACAHRAGEWTLHCPACDAFDTLHWGQPVARAEESAPVDRFAAPLELAL